METEVRIGDSGRTPVHSGRPFEAEPRVFADSPPTGLLYPEDDPAPNLPLPAWRQRLTFGTLQLLWQHRVFVAIMILLAGGAGFVSARLRTPYYIARATIYPPPAEGSINGLGLAGVAGMIGSLGLGGGSAGSFPLYETFVASRTVITELLGLRLDEVGFEGTLLQRLAITDPDPDRQLDMAIATVRQRLMFEPDKKTGVVTIGYLDSNARVAAFVANHVVDALDRFDVRTAIRRAGNKRLFIEQRMAESSARLTAAELGLERFRQENLRIGNSPELLLEQVRLQRELDIEQQVYLTLRKEYELTRIEEERSVPVVNVLDRAAAPVTPAGPSVIKFTLAAAFLGAFFVVGCLALVALQPRRTLDELLLAARLR